MKNPLAKFKSITKGIKVDRRNAVLFAYEGILITLINNFINNNNNLFATRLGATNLELSLVASLPQVVGMLVLIPGGILTDRMRNKRQMIIAALVILAGFYLALGFVPMMGKSRFFMFLILISLSIGPMTIYNASWQAYFSDVVPRSKRNKTFTLRTRWTFVINIAAPIVTGTLLASAATNDEKLKFHQSFFWAGCLFIILQILVLREISGGSSEKVHKVKLEELKNTFIGLMHNKKFLGFIGVALFFYMGWQADWTLYYIGQITYLKLNEAWLAYVNVGGALVQFLTIGFWSRVNERRGVRFGIIMGSFGLSLFPLIIILGSILPSSIAATVFLILSTLANFAFATISLNIMQCLLQVIPEEGKTFSISIYTLLVTLSNAVMPIAGVKLYTNLGANVGAFHKTFLILFVLRLAATGLWTLRWWVMRNESK